MTVKPKGDELDCSFYKSVTETKVKQLPLEEEEQSTSVMVVIIIIMSIYCVLNIGLASIGNIKKIYI